MERQSDERDDTVQVSRTAFKLATTLVTAFILAISGILWNIVLDNVRLNGRVTQLELFGPSSGKRFTKDDGDKVEKRHLVDMMDVRASIKEINQELIRLRLTDSAISERDSVAAQKVEQLRLDCTACQKRFYKRD